MSDVRSPSGATPESALSSTDAQSLVDRTLTKYVWVWLWSVQVGATSGLAYSLVGLNVDRTWGSLGGSLLVLAVLTLVIVGAAWFSLYNYLSRYLLPLFIWPDRVSPTQLSSERAPPPSEHDPVMMEDRFYYSPGRAAR